MKVTEVTLLEDRAQVHREGSVELKAGLNKVVIQAVAPVLVDKSLTVRTEGAQVVDVAVVRKRVVVRSELDDDARKLAQELDEMEAQLRDQESQLELVRSDIQAHQLLHQLTHSEIAEDVAWGKMEPADWARRLDQSQAELEASHRKVARLEQELTEGLRRRSRLEHRLQLMHNPSFEMHAEIHLRLEAASPTSETLKVQYLVPGACWRPVHVAELVEKGGDMELLFSSQASLWQNTGEPWNDVEVRLSTERASLGLEPPVLSSDELSVRPKDRQLVVETRQAEIEDAGLGATKTIYEAPGIDDGGEVRLLRPATRASIPSDGRPVRIPLSSFTQSVQVLRVLMAELEPKVILKTLQANQTQQPMLPGPVELRRRGGPVGRTSVAFVGSGESFELGWGPDPELRVLRRHQKLPAKTRALSSWVTVPYQTEVFMSNIGPEARTIEVVERVPVSEIEKVRVELQSATHGARPDRDGFLRWKIELEGFGHATVQHEYHLMRHSDVVDMG